MACIVEALLHAGALEDMKCSQDEIHRIRIMCNTAYFLHKSHYDYKGL